MSNHIEADVHNVASRIHKIFNELKTEQMGKPYRPMARFRDDRVWMVAAENCIEEGADPYSFVRASFLYGQAIPGGPFPNQVCSKAAVRWYRDYVQNVVEFKKDGESAYVAEVRSILKMAVDGALVRRVTFRAYFLDPSVTLDVLPAFARVVLMPDDPVVVERWGRKAYQEVMGNQRLLDALVSLKSDLRFLEKYQK